MENTKIQEIQCKNILNKSGIRGIDYCVNPYLGCEHGCKYCYARFMKRFHRGKDNWGSFVDVKINALERLEDEASRKAYGLVLLSSVTDPYQPVEKKYKLTRGALKILSEYGFSVDILTKSDLALRDIDILSSLDVCEVGFTITTLDERVRKAFEPKSTTVMRRIRALKEFQETGIKTYAFLGPLLPYLSEKSLEPLLDALVDKVDRILIDRLNIKSGNWPSIRNALLRYYPEIVSEFKNAARDNSKYYQKLGRKVERMCSDRFIEADILF